ncbi:MAG TPA: PQQ-binding-like beta-propeller repeat protein [Amnibacterium sp.]
MNTAEAGLNPSNVGGIQQRWHMGFATKGAFDATPVGASNVGTRLGTLNLIYVGDERGGFGAMDAATGTVVWQHKVGFQHTTCGDFPSGNAGVTGAATLDRATNRVYVVGGDGKLYAFDMGTGDPASGWTPTTVTSDPAHLHVYGGLTLDPTRHTIYAGLASYCDHTPYRGRLVAVDTGSRTVRSFVVIKNKTQSGGGIWGWGGASLDPGGNPYVTTGNALPNGATEATPYAEYVVKLSPSLAVLGAHHPTLTGRDVDFGATPTLIDLRITGCSLRLAAENKNGFLYIYNRDDIKAGPVETVPIANGSAHNYFQGLPAYDRSSRTLYISNPGDGGRRHGVVALRFGTNCRTTLLWNSVAGPTASPVSPPVVANGVVFYADGTGRTVHAFTATTGHKLWTSAAGLFGGPVFGAPLVFDGRVFVPSRGGTLHAFG